MIAYITEDGDELIGAESDDEVIVAYSDGPSPSSTCVGVGYRAGHCIGSPYIPSDRGCSVCPLPSGTNQTRTSYLSVTPSSALIARSSATAEVTNARLAKVGRS